MIKPISKSANCLEQVMSKRFWMEGSKGRDLNLQIKGDNLGMVYDLLRYIEYLKGNIL